MSNGWNGPAITFCRLSKECIEHRFPRRSVDACRVGQHAVEVEDSRVAVAPIYRECGLDHHRSLQDLAANRDASVAGARCGAIRPAPVLDFRHVLAVLVDIAAVLDELVAEMLPDMGGLGL